MKELLTTKDIDSMLEQSNQSPILVLKHSTSCPISAHAYKAFSSFIEQQNPEGKGLNVAYVKVIESRPASLYLAEKIELRHQSPQIILIEQGKVVWHESHWQITVEQLNSVMTNMENNS